MDSRMSKDIAAAHATPDDGRLTGMYVEAAGKRGPAVDRPGHLPDAWRAFHGAHAQARSKAA
jgi:hypothetical protein